MFCRKETQIGLNYHEYLNLTVSKESAKVTLWIFDINISFSILTKILELGDSNSISRLTLSCGVGLLHTNNMHDLEFQIEDIIKFVK